jgi:hypothetical protein
MKSATRQQEPFYELGSTSNITRSRYARGVGGAAARETKTHTWVAISETRNQADLVSRRPQRRRGPLKRQRWALVHFFKLKAW